VRRKDPLPYNYLTERSHSVYGCTGVYDWPTLVLPGLVGLGREQPGRASACRLG
jgi:hypothetical protein